MSQFDDDGDRFRDEMEARWMEKVLENQRQNRKRVFMNNMEYEWNKPENRFARFVNKLLGRPYLTKEKYDALVLRIREEL